MVDDAKWQEGKLADQVSRIIHEHATAAAAAVAIVEQLPQLLYQMGWAPPEMTERVQDWAARTGSIPEHHVNRGVLTSHLVELSQILRDRLAQLVPYLGRPSCVVPG